MACCIEPVQPADLAALAALEQLCFSTPWSEAALAAELPKAGSVFLKAVLEGQVCGYIGMNTVLDEGYITNVAVHPQCRRRGVARQLLAALLAQGELMGLAFVTLEVRVSNAPAIALYRSQGFAKVGRRRGFYSHPHEDALLMSCFFRH